ncbi:MAG: hypothetical protein CM15mP120_29820 [Pseudomonadota bacterium]|nr:MAG: hypothetical protein CM15mP120_29820 [Pseudomonadota bacterium]
MGWCRNTPHCKTKRRLMEKQRTMVPPLCKHGGHVVGLWEGEREVALELNPLGGRSHCFDRLPCPAMQVAPAVMYRHVDAGAGR